MNTVYIYKRKYVKFATIPTSIGFALAAFLIEEEGGEIVSISEPRIVKIIPKTVLSLPGEVASPFLLSAPFSKAIFKKATLSPYVDYFYSNTENFAVYSPRAPTARYIVSS